MQPVWTLTAYFVRRLFLSLAGVIYLILTLVYWGVFFPPQQGTPEIENYMLIIGAFGAAVSFLVTLTIAARANQAKYYPLVVRLKSRVEYLTAVLLSTFIVTSLLQLLLAILALIRGPDLDFGRFLEIPPLWIAVNILAVVLALHASDFVTAGWSRVYLYGVLGILLLGQNSGATISRWIANRLYGFSFTISEANGFVIGEWLRRLATWLETSENGILSRLFDVVAWPFQAILNAIVSGYFNAAQAMAPAIILLYATVLFLLAANLFASKDLDFTE